MTTTTSTTSMAKSEENKTPAAKVEEMKRELRRLVRLMTEEEDGKIETYDKAVQAIAAIKEFKFGKCDSVAAGEGKVEVPKHFLCPLSSQLMRDPVVLATGETYDRPFIQKWLNSGNRMCPQSQQVLTDATLTPNHLVRSMISQWCSKKGILLPLKNIDEDAAVGYSDRDLLKNLLDKIAFSSIPEQKQALKELRLLTKRNNSFRALLSENPDGISQLLGISSKSGLDNDQEVQEDMITTILNFAIHESNKQILGNNPQAIPLLIKALSSGTMETKRNAAAALFTLSAIDSNKIKIGELGAIRPLVELLERGTPAAKRDAASALFNLCTDRENKTKAVDEGAASVALKEVMDGSLVDECLSILALLSNNQDAIEQICDRGGVPCLLGLIRQSSCRRIRENAIAVLFSICMIDKARLREVGEEENLNGTLSQLAENGTQRARRKAAGIIERLKRLHITYHSC